MKKLILLFALFLAYQTFAQTNILVTSDFEDGKTGDWQGRGSASLSATNETAHTGKYSLFTTGRSAGWNGPAIYLTGKVVNSGVYKFSVWVKIKTGQPDSEMIITAQREKGSNQGWDRIASGNANSKTWVNLTGEYEANNEFDKISVYIESPNTTLEYYIDDFTVSVTKAPVRQESASGMDKSIPSLADVYKNNFVIGTAVELNQLEGTEGELVLKHFSGLTAENIMKPQYLAPKENSYNFDSADKLVNYAVKNNKRLRGHTLLWHEQNAKWMFYDNSGKKVSKKVLLERLEKFITTVVSRYKGKVYAWDVVNEVVEGTGLRKTDWLDIAGEEYIEKAFIFARKADPNAKLFINDFDTTERNKGNTLYNLVKRLLAKKVPVDGIGMQFHITIDYPALQSINDSLKKFSELGLEIHITELDMSLNADPNLKADKAPEELLIRQGYRYKEIFDIFKTYKLITNVTFWGFQDGHTWLTNSPVKKVDWPLLFDQNYSAKYAYWALVDPKKLPQDVVLKSRKNNFTATAIKGTPVIDGVMDDMWKKAPDININLYVQGNGATGVAKAMWDEKNLYVFVKVSDKNLSKTNSNVWEQDSFEIFVDEKNNKSVDYLEDDAQYRINFENDFSSRGNPAKIKSVPVVLKPGYTIEVMIPLQTIKGTAGTKIGFDLQINDDPGTGKRETITKWNDPTDESYRNTSGFGTLIFSE